MATAIENEEQLMQEELNDSYEIEQLEEERFYSFPSFVIDFRCIDCTAPTQLINEPPNNEQAYKRQLKIPTTRYGINIQSCELINLDGLIPLVQKLVKPTHLTRLDLSCNRIRTLCDFSQLKHLQMLYLHGNDIQNYEDLSPIIKCPSIAYLTLHGNPVSLTHNLRTYLVSKLPNLKNLDFSLVTEVERQIAATFDFRQFGTKRQNVILQKLMTPGQLKEAREQALQEQEQAKAESDRKRKAEAENALKASALKQSKKP